MQIKANFSMKFKNNYPMLEAANPDPSTPKVARKLYRIRKSNCPFKLGTACILYPTHITRKTGCPFKFGAARKLYRIHFVGKTDCPFTRSSM